MRKNNKPSRQKVKGWSKSFLVIGIFVFSFSCMESSLSRESLSWEVSVTPFNQLFPSLELSQMRRQSSKEFATESANVVGKGSGLIAIKARPHQVPSPLSFIVEIPGLKALSETTVNFSQIPSEYEIRPLLDWDIGRLRSTQSPYEEILTVTIRNEQETLDQRRVKVSIRPLNEALYYVQDGNDKVDLSWIFAAYVNPHDPVVTKILNDAKNTAFVEEFDGYRGGDIQKIYRQVWAVWHAIESHGVRYSNADPAVSRGPNIFSQRVRFLADIWNDKKANCVDGSVLLASVLEHLGIHSFIILIPGHAFLGFYTDKAERNAAYIETTLLGETSLTPLQSPPTFAADFSLRKNDLRSLTSFSAALATGRARFAKVAKKLDGRHRPDYVLIDIATARAYGIMPIVLTVP